MRSWYIINLIELIFNRWNASVVSIVTILSPRINSGSKHICLVIRLWIIDLEPEGST